MNFHHLLFKNHIYVHTYINELSSDQDGHKESNLLSEKDKKKSSSDKRFTFMTYINKKVYIIYTAQNIFDKAEKVIQESR